jgi:hypothetical protein
MARTSRKFAIAHGAQFAAQCLLGDHDAEFLVNPLAEIDDPPSHDAMNSRDRAALDDCDQGGAMAVVQPRLLSRRLAIDQAVRPVSVEPEHPIANDLKRHTANLRRLGARRSVVDRRKSQQSARLRPILRTPRRRPKCPRVIVISKTNRCRHREPPLFATSNQISTDSGIPLMSPPH